MDHLKIYESINLNIKPNRILAEIIYNVPLNENNKYSYENFDSCKYVFVVVKLSKKQNVWFSRMRIMTVEWGALSLGMCQQAKEVVNIGNAMNNEGVTLLSRITSAKLNSKEWPDIGNCCLMAVEPGSALKLLHKGE